MSLKKSGCEWENEQERGKKGCEQACSGIFVCGEFQVEELRGSSGKLGQFQKMLTYLLYQADSFMQRGYLSKSPNMLIFALKGQLLTQQLIKLDLTCFTLMLTL
jgi:hypothetical protein